MAIYQNVIICYFKTVTMTLIWSNDMFVNLEHFHVTLVLATLNDIIIIDDDVFVDRQNKFKKALLILLKWFCQKHVYKYKLFEKEKRYKWKPHMLYVHVRKCGNSLHASVAKFIWRKKKTKIKLSEKKKYWNGNAMGAWE